jgi:aerobic carbon-monoxide dehydrogenase medium subunit
MKPASFEFIRARSVAEATRLLVEADGAGRVIAGAQSLGPMLNLRLVRPRLLIDITGIPELTHIEDVGDSVTLGACVTTANIEDGKLPGWGFEALRSIATRIAYRAIRNRSTIGGSFCHADPAADWVSVLCALGAECLLSGVNGKRWVAANQFITGAYETALAPSEVLEAIKLPRPSQRSRFGYFKVCRKAGEFALAMGAVMNDPERRELRMVIGATKTRPIVVDDASGLLSGDSTIDEARVLRVLDQHGITDLVSRRQQVAALTRAYDQAMKP